MYKVVINLKNSIIYKTAPSHQKRYISSNFMAFITSLVKGYKTNMSSCAKLCYNVLTSLAVKSYMKLSNETVLNFFSKMVNLERPEILTWYDPRKFEKDINDLCAMDEAEDSDKWKKETDRHIPKTVKTTD